MLSREYDKRIEIWETISVPDGFGGNTVSEELLFKSWAKIETKGVGYKANDFGIDEFNNPVIFKVRYRNDFQYEGRTLYAMYRNEKYIIQGIRNSGQRNIELDIFCSKLD